MRKMQRNIFHFISNSIETIYLNVDVKLGSLIHIYPLVYDETYFFYFY